MAAAVPDLRTLVPGALDAASAMEKLPEVVLAAVKLAEATGKPGPDKKAYAIKLVSEFYAVQPVVNGQLQEAVFSISADVLSFLVPALIDRMVEIDKGMLVIDPSSRTYRCAQLCCPLLCCGAKAAVAEVAKKV